MEMIFLEEKKRMVSSTKSLKHVFLQTNKKKRENKRDLGRGGEGGDPGVS